MTTTTTARPVVSPYLDDPERFAAELYSHLAGGGERRVWEHAAAEYRAYEAAMRVLKERSPQDTGLDGPVTVADEAALAWANASNVAGIRFGIAAEQLRRSLLAAAE